MGGLDGAVLVRHARVVARGGHAAVGAQGLVAPGLVLGGVAFEVAERGREAVAAVFGGHAAQRPQRVLQPGGQGREALAAQDDLGVLPAGEGQAEVVEPVRQRLSGERHPERAGVGGVGQAPGAGRVLLAEDHLALRPVRRLPVAHPALQRAPHPIAQRSHGVMSPKGDGATARGGGAASPRRRPRAAGRAWPGARARSRPPTPRPAGRGGGHGARGFARAGGGRHRGERRCSR